MKSKKRKLRRNIMILLMTKKRKRRRKKRKNKANKCHLLIIRKMVNSKITISSKKMINL